MNSPKSAISPYEAFAFHCLIKLSPKTLDSLSNAGMETQTHKFPAHSVPSRLSQLSEQGYLFNYCYTSPRQIAKDGSRFLTLETRYILECRTLGEWKVCLIQRDNASAPALPYPKDCSL